MRIIPTIPTTKSYHLDLDSLQDTFLFPAMRGISTIKEWSSLSQESQLRKPTLCGNRHGICPKIKEQWTTYCQMLTSCMSPMCKSGMQKPHLLMVATLWRYRGRNGHVPMMVA